ncbi:multidrug ABC transporter substrate-binding protein [Bacteroides sp. AM07-16]|uniref:ABC transporter permease n=1 Tax=Parabacteroides bouchesdurhonensis TaxID=1936995 RepID=UPI000E4D2B86|nr:FtsX-like permease family protein [Parabacteroides bouchesdurhonensis]RHJ92427.1 multidrug ABC transporter substrate-binding protein [Bacteroides sp. AM07-16]
MIKHILKIIWNQRRSNGWIFAELLIVAGFLWVMIDTFYVDMVTYRSPLGYDITNVWRFKLTEEGRTDTLPGLSEPEKLTRLIEQIRQNPEVYEVCATFYSCPYSFGNSWRSITPLDGDSSISSAQSFQIRNVTPEYFRLFNVQNSDGKPVYDEVSGVRNALVVSREMADMFYPGKQARGRKVRYDSKEEVFTIASVSSSIRANEYERPEPCFFQCLNGEIYNLVVEDFGARDAELCVRMKRSLSRDDMNLFLDSMGDRLTADNLMVYGITPMQEFRDIQLSGKERDMSNKFSLMLFMLINVFFGIIGTFWLRMQNRRGEIGLRMALGAHRITLQQYMYAEGLCLLAFSLPLVLLFGVNLLMTDYIDTYRQSLSVARVLVTLGATYLLMGGMIILGIWFPVRQAVRMAPADALHYE